MMLLIDSPVSVSNEASLSGITKTVDILQRIVTSQWRLKATVTRESLGDTTVT